MKHFFAVRLSELTVAATAAAHASVALAIVSAILAAIALSIFPGCSERGFSSDLYVLEELEAASRVADSEERVRRLEIFTANHPQHPYRVMGYQRLFETLAGDIGDWERAAAYFDEVLAAEKEVRVRGELWYRRFAYLWDTDRAGAIKLAGELCNGTEQYYRLYFYLALYLMDEEDQTGLAERCFMKAGELAPPGQEQAQVLGEYGAFLDKAGRTEEALEILGEATRYGFANEPLGRILWERGEREAAIDAYLRLVARVPGARKRIGLDSLYAIVYPDARKTDERNLEAHTSDERGLDGREIEERIMALRMSDEMIIPEARFVDIEGREYRLERFRGTPLVLIAFSPT